MIRCSAAFLGLVLAEDLQSLIDLGLQSLRRLEEVEKFAVVHLQEHTWTKGGHVPNLITQDPKSDINTLESSELR